MSIDEMIAVLQAAKEGEKIQCRHKEDITKEWGDCRSKEDGAGPTWNFFSYDYRVAPKPRELFRAEQNGELFGLFAQEADAKKHEKAVRFREMMEGEK